MSSVDEIYTEEQLEAQIKEIDRKISELRTARYGYQRRLEDAIVLRTNHCVNCNGKGEYENNHNGDWTDCWCPFGQKRKENK